MITHLAIAFFKLVTLLYLQQNTLQTMVSLLELQRFTILEVIADDMIENPFFEGYS